MQLLRKKVLGFIKAQGLFIPGDRVVVGVSGGADSMALLDILATLPGFPLQLVAAHLNHALRGDESDGDERFVGNMAEKYGIPLEISRVDIHEVAQQRGLSLEEAGREARRTFFMEVAEKYSAASVALGHHRDDQAETMLMRLIRGAGGSGLTGMRSKLPSSLFVRPLLCLSRSEIQQYLLNRKLEWREDSSNSDTKFLRNRVRHELLPMLANYNPRIAELLNSTADTLAADEELVESLVDKVCSENVAVFSDEVMVRTDTLKKEPQALRKRIYRRALLLLSGDLKRISSTHLGDIDSLVTSDRGSGCLSLPTGLTVCREYETLLFRKVRDEIQSDYAELLIDSTGLFPLPQGRTLSIRQIEDIPIDWHADDRDTIFVDIARLPFPWVIRSPESGDRFTPFGMSGRKKLKDLFIDRKIPARERKKIPVFFCRGEIFWVGGVQAAEKIRVTGVGGELLCLSIS